VRAGAEPFTILHFHRTLSEWFNGCIDAGFAIERIGEPTADATMALAHPAVADTRVTPLFLHLRVRKPGASPRAESGSGPSTSSG
jgi:hypothetical protein